MIELTSKSVESGSETAVPVNSSTDEPQVTCEVLSGRTLYGRLRVIGELGTGGMSSVYLAEDLTLRRPVALKVLQHKYSMDRKQFLRFNQEARAAARLDHPNIVKIFEYGISDLGAPYILMDVVEGETLAEKLRQEQNLDLHTAIHLLSQLCTALQHACEKQVVHRDLKPSNIMLGKNQHGKCTAKIVDFGIAKITADDGSGQPAVTATGEVFGTPLYMSPEQGIGKRTDHRSDIYSLGCVMYECLTGMPPFSGNNALQTLMMHQYESALSLKEATLGRYFPREIEDIVAKMIAKLPEDRYQSYADILADIEVFHVGIKSLKKFQCALRATAIRKHPTQADPIQIYELNTQVYRQAEEDERIWRMIAFMLGIVPVLVMATVCFFSLNSFLGWLGSVGCMSVFLLGLLLISVTLKMLKDEMNRGSVWP